jgi:hypothetical protein
MDPDPTPLFIDFKDAKKISYFFLITSTSLSIYKHFLGTNFVLKFYFAGIISVGSTHSNYTLMRKGKDPEPDPDQHR